jgi:uncharacterized caspase-like protein
VVGAGASRGALYFLGFGVSRYQDARLNLGFAHKDAADLMHRFGSMRGAFTAVYTKTYVNEEVTTGNLREAKSWLASAGVNDTTIVFVAGHGTHARDAAADYYYVTYDTDLRSLSKTAAPFELIEDLVRASRSRRKLLLLDTCESGEVDDADDTIGALHAGDEQSRSVRLVIGPKESAGELVERRRARTFLLDRNRMIYSALSRRSGAVVLSSSRGTEESFESASLANGYFTHALLRALSDPGADSNGDAELSPEELRAFVASEVERLSKGRQHPTIDLDNPLSTLTLPAAVR